MFQCWNSTQYWLSTASTEQLEMNPTLVQLEFLVYSIYKSIMLYFNVKYSTIKAKEVL